MMIHVTSELTNARHLAVDPREIIVSPQPLQSSMRNSFSGRLTLIAEEGNAIRLTIECAERFHVIISSEALISLNLSLGDTVWLSFKSTAVTVF
jgi:tungstate transport system ATP-binding protein